MCTGVFQACTPLLPPWTVFSLHWPAGFSEAPGKGRYRRSNWRKRQGSLPRSSRVFTEAIHHPKSKLLLGGLSSGARTPLGTCTPGGRNGTLRMLRSHAPLPPLHPLSPVPTPETVCVQSPLLILAERHLLCSQGAATHRGSGFNPFPMGSEKSHQWCCVCPEIRHGFLLTTQKYIIKH